jgi:glycosyltransferase involved in cell wall biosynthesis
MTGIAVGDAGPYDIAPPATIEAGRPSRRYQSGTARILFISPTAEATGPTTSLRLLLRHLSKTHRLEVLLSGEGEFRSILDEQGVPRWDLEWPEGRAWPRRLPSRYRLVRWFRREGFDLVYANEITSATRDVCLAAWLAGTPFVCHVRNMGWRLGWKHLGHFRAAEAVIAVSHACGASVERHVRRGRLHVVHNGVPAPELPMDREQLQGQIKRELGVDPSTKLLLSVGHVNPRKAQAYALDAMEILLEQGLDVHLCLLGKLDRDPEYVRRIRGRAARAPLEGRVSVLGFRRDVFRLLLGADILVHTALHDPHPRAVLEGMAAALPVVAFSTDGVSETVVPGQTGHLVPRKDARALASSLQGLLDPEKARQFGYAGRLRVEREFSETQTAERVGDLLGGVLRERGVIG